MTAKRTAQTRQTEPTPEPITDDRMAKMRLAVQLYFGTTDSWEKVAQRLGVKRETLWRWRQTEAWEIARGEGIAELYDDELRRAAMHAWLKRLEAGDAQVLVRSLEAFGQIGPERRDWTIRSGDGDDLDGELSILLRFAREQGLE